MNTNNTQVSAPSVRVLIVDDHPLVRRGIAAVVQSEAGLTLCGQASNAAETIAMLNEAKPDLVLLDISMPDLNGIDLIRNLRLKNPVLKVLMLSMHKEEVYAERALRSGANGYVMKDEPIEVVLTAIRSVMKNGSYFSRQIAERINERPLGELISNNFDTAAGLDSLTNRELQIFHYIGNGMSSRKIAEMLNLSVRTVHVHREHIKRKMGFRNAPELVHHATHWAQNYGMPENVTSKRGRKRVVSGAPRGKPVTHA